jgi:hypothetical protein
MVYIIFPGRYVDDIAKACETGQSPASHILSPPYARALNQFHGNPILSNRLLESFYEAQEQYPVLKLRFVGYEIKRGALAPKIHSCA